MTGPRLCAHAGLLVALGGATGCEAVDPGGRAAVWTTFDFRAAQDTGEMIAAGISEAFPAGWPSAAFVHPAAAGADADVASEAVVRIAFVEGKPAAYVTTELWTNYREIWVQPMYVLITRWDQDDPGVTWLEGARWIFPVGADSRFYSPFWQVIYAVVPESTPPDKYRSSAQILGDRLELHPGPARLVALVPGDVGVESSATSMPGRLGHPASAPSRSWGWVDGVQPRVRILDFGEQRFEFDEQREVASQPLFVFTARQPDGSYAPVGAPNVGGTGPLFARRPPLAPGGRPLFGSLWRLHTVRLPASDPNVGLFLPATARFDGLRQEVAASLRGVAIPPVSWEFANPAEARNHLLKIALNGATCFKDEASLAECRWLDSQAAIEDRLPGAITATDVAVTCPLVAYDGAEIPPP